LKNVIILFVVVDTMMIVEIITLKKLLRKYIVF